jgi:hypothetical protein
MEKIVRTAVQERRNITQAEIPEPASETLEVARPPAPVESEQTERAAPVIEALEQDLAVPGEGVPEEVPAVSQEEQAITLYPFRAFDSAGPAKRFAESILKSAGVELQVERQAHRYVVLIPALDETDKERKAELIREKAGVKP